MLITALPAINDLKPFNKLLTAPAEGFDALYLFKHNNSLHPSLQLLTLIF